MLCQEDEEITEKAEDRPEVEVSILSTQVLVTAQRRPYRKVDTLRGLILSIGLAIVATGGYRAYNEHYSAKALLAAQAISQADSEQDKRLERVETKQAAGFERLHEIETKLGADHDDISAIKGDVKLVTSKIDTLTNLAILIFGAILTLLLERGASYLSEMKKKQSTR